MYSAATWVFPVAEKYTTRVRPVDTFVAANDFTGKTVIPFCTSSSSGIGESGQLLADLAGTGDWQEGQRFSSSVDQAEVQDWLEELSL